MKVVFFNGPGFDYLSSQLTEGFHLRDDVELACTHKSTHHGAQVDDLEIVGEKEAYDLCYDADMILVSTGGDMGHMDGVRGQVLRECGRKISFIDGHDGDDFLVDPKDICVYFKRESRYPTVCQWVYPNVRSLTFGIYQFCMDNLSTDNLAHQFDFERDIDISFMAFGGSHPLRKEVAEILDSMNGNGFTTYARVSNDCQPVTMGEYRDVLRRSKVGISVIGAGFDTLRFWETMGHGAVLCSFDVVSKLAMRNVPEPHRHALYFDSWHRMVELCRLVVSDKQRWIRMRRATDRLLECHTTKHRALEVMEAFKEMR